MTEIGIDKQELLRENKRLQKEVRDLKFENQKLQQEISKWEHCHRQDMEDNLRLQNQVAMLMGWDTVYGGNNEHV